MPRNWIQRGNTLYVLDEPTTVLHPSDVEKLIAQLDGLVESGNTVIVIEHDMSFLPADWTHDEDSVAGRVEQIKRTRASLLVFRRSKDGHL